MEISIENYDTLVKQFVDDKLTKVKHEHCPRPPFRMLVSGCSGCGKSNFVINMITKFLSFDKLIICCSTLYQPKYQMLKALFDDADEQVKESLRIKLRKVRIKSKKLTPEQIEQQVDEIFEPICDYYESPQQINLDFLKDTHKQSIVLFDDVLLEPKQKNAVEVFSKGRHCNISVIYITQSFYGTPKLIRNNISIFCIFKTCSKIDLDKWLPQT